MTLPDDVERQFKGRHYERNDGTCTDTWIRIEGYGKHTDNHYHFSGVIVDRTSGIRCGGDLLQMRCLNGYTEVPKSRIPFLRKA